MAIFISNFILRGIALILFSSAVWAAKPQKIDVKAELLVNGQVVASPRLVAVSGEEATITSGRGRGRLKMKVLARPTSAKMDELKMDFDLHYADGEKSIHAQPEVIARAGFEAVMTLEESTKEEKIQFRILAVPTNR